MAAELRTRHLVIELSGAELRRLAQPMLDLMNAQQQEGTTIDMVLASAAYVVGWAIAQRGGILPLDKPLREALPPLVLGYEQFNSTKQQA